MVCLAAPIGWEEVTEGRVGGRHSTLMYGLSFALQAPGLDLTGHLGGGVGPLQGCPSQRLREPGFVLHSPLPLAEGCSGS